MLSIACRTPDYYRDSMKKRVSFTLLYTPTAFNLSRALTPRYSYLLRAFEGAHHATAVLVDELDACGLQGTADRELAVVLKGSLALAPLCNSEKSRCRK